MILFLFCILRLNTYFPMKFNNVFVLVVGLSGIFFIYIVSVSPTKKFVILLFIHGSTRYNPKFVHA